MTFGNMRANGVRSLAVSCWQCHHEAVVSANRCPTPCQWLGRIVGGTGGHVVPDEVEDMHHAFRSSRRVTLSHRRRLGQRLTNRWKTLWQTMSQIIDDVIKHRLRLRLRNIETF
jgi:hypothetical protein